MKRFLLAVLVSLFVVSVSVADTATVSLSVTGGQAIAYSDAIPVSGILEKVEIVQTANVTNTIVLATYSGTTAIDTYVSLASLATSTKLVRPAFLPTANTGTALAAVIGSGTDALTNLVSQVLVVPYAKAILGGNVKLAVTTDSATGEAASTVTATIYYTRLEK